MKTSRSIQIVAGISLNGMIANQDRQFAPYASPEDQAWLKQKIMESDLLLMGRKTYEQHVGKITKPLIVMSRQPRTVRLKDNKRQTVHWFHGNRDDMLHLLDILQYENIMVLGGSEIYHWVLRENLATDIFLTVEPVIISQGKHFLEGEVLQKQKSWKLISYTRLNDRGSMLLHYQP